MLFRLSTLFSCLLLATMASATGFDEARHLLVRTGMGAAPAEIDALLPLTYDQAVDRLLAAARSEVVDNGDN